MHAHTESRFVKAQALGYGLSIVRNAPPDGFNLFSQRLQLFTGKGGVGKTCLVAALAMEAARRGQRPLVIELGHRASMQGAFGVDSIGYQPELVAPGVWAMNMDADQALFDYVAGVVRVERLAKTITTNPALSRFFQAAPAVTEVVTLAKLQRLLDERDGELAKWQPILVDFDATGHALMFLELPQVLEGLVSSGTLRRLLESFSALLVNRELTRLHLVTLPGELPISETIQLYQEIHQAGKVSLGALFINQVPEPPLARRLFPTLKLLHHSAQQLGSPTLLANLLLTLQAIEHHQAIVQRLNLLHQAIPLPTCTLPLLDKAKLDRSDLSLLGTLAAQRLCPEVS
jgi:arsenite/tail-anchored protein-transporting ATPase